jgi:intracellular septation protein
MKLLFDFLPGILFVVALFLRDIYFATAVVMGAMSLQVLAMLVMRKKVSGIQWFTLGVILLFGTATLVLHNPTFIKWKPTVINWMFAVILLLGPVLLKKNFIKSLLGEQLTLPAEVWTRLNTGWAALLAFLGVLNLVVAFNFSERIWALYKVFGMTGIMLVFILLQAIYLGRHMPADNDKGTPES